MKLLVKTKKLVGDFPFYASILKRVFRQYAQEIKYFVRAKKRYIHNGYLKSNPSLEKSSSLGTLSVCTSFILISYSGKCGKRN